MEISDWLRILEELGIDTVHLTETLDVNSGRALRMRDGSKVLGGGVYFNRNRGGVVHFTINHNSTVRTFDIDWGLWNDLPSSQVKRKDRGKPNIYPNPGMERRALRRLLA